MSKKCKSGEIFRKGFVRRSKSGSKTKVKGKCIRATSQSKKKRSDSDKKIIAKRQKSYKLARNKFKDELPNCPKGTIMREGYKRRSSSRSKSKKGSWVKPTCVPSLNREKKPRLFVLEKGVLEKYGYKNISELTEKQRHQALNNALEDIEPLPLYRRINALYILQRNSNPDLAARFRDDAEYVKRTKAYANRVTADRNNVDNSS